MSVTDTFAAVHRIELGRATAFLVIHATPHGRAFGGIRVREYPSDDDALADAQALALAMSRKVVLARIPAGGAKTVVRLPDGGWPAHERAAGLRRLGAFIESLGGLYYCGADVGFTDDDEDALRATTSHVASRSVGEWTSRSVLLAMEAVCDPQSIAIQGVGAVGAGVGAVLLERGVQVTVADVDQGCAESLAGATVVAPEAIYDVESDVFSPCATGGVLDAETIPRLRCKFVCGGANNPLADDAAADLLHERGIAYVPDVLANAGAVIKGASDALGESELVEQRLAGIVERVRDVMQTSRSANRSPHHVVNELADALLILALER